MRTKTIALGLILICLSVSPFSHGGEKPGIFQHERGIWEISGPPGQKRWVIIHNLDEAKQTGVFHIEIIGRDKGQPKWSIKHVCDHMAITTEALMRSIIRPLQSGAVYPESFDSALAEWKRKAAKGEGVICTTSIADCLRGN